MTYLRVRRKKIDTRKKHNRFIFTENVKSRISKYERKKTNK